MKNRWMKLLGWIALFVCVPCVNAQEEKQDDPPAEDEIVGTWYPQVMDGEVVPADMNVRLVFEKNGLAKFYEDDEEPDVQGYIHDKKRGTVTIHAENEPDDIEVVLKYRFSGGTLVFSDQDGDEGDAQVVEVTRNREGSERHKKMRKIGEFIPLPKPANPADADDNEGLPVGDTIIGTWYMQIMEGELVPADEQIRITFDKKGVVRVFEGDNEDEVGQYSHDKDRSIIKIYEDDDPTDLEAIIEYSFVDDMLVMKVTEDPGRQNNDTAVFELTRNPEGAKHHQALRKERGDQPGRRAQMRQMQRMRQLFMAAMLYSSDHKDKLPASLGELVVKEYLDIDLALPAPPPDRLPKDFGEWEGAKKAEWINQRTGCVYIKVDLNVPDADKQIAIIEVPTSKEQEKITLIFADGHGELQAYKEADREVSKQTGHTLEQWMKSKSPGSGEAPPKEEKDE